MWDWIVDNKVFSGIGGVVLTIVAGIFIKNKKDSNKPSQSITSGNNSNNIQGGNDVNVTIGDKNDRR